MSSKSAAHKTLKALTSGILQNTRERAEEGSRKTSHQLERYVKGVANHHRISILFLVAERPGITLDGIVQTLRGNEKTFSEYTKKLLHAGLIVKKYRGTSVEHYLSTQGKAFHAFLRSL